MGKTVHLGKTCPDIIFEDSVSEDSVSEDSVLRSAIAQNLRELRANECYRPN